MMIMNDFQLISAVACNCLQVTTGQQSCQAWITQNCMSLSGSLCLTMIVQTAAAQQRRACSVRTHKATAQQITQHIPSVKLR